MLRRAALALILWSASHAQVANLAFDHFRLPNGMEAILHVDRKTPIVHFNMRFRAGSRDDPAGHSGLAHLFEHLLFHGRGEFSDYSAAFERLGIGASATTDIDYTE